MPGRKKNCNMFHWSTTKVQQRDIPVPGPAWAGLWAKPKREKIGGGDLVWFLTVRCTSFRMCVCFTWAEEASRIAQHGRMYPGMYVHMYKAPWTEHTHTHITPSPLSRPSIPIISITVQPNLAGEKSSIWPEIGPWDGGGGKRGGARKISRSGYVVQSPL